MIDYTANYGIVMMSTMPCMIVWSAVTYWIQKIYAFSNDHHVCCQKSHSQPLYVFIS